MSSRNPLVVGLVALAIPFMAADTYSGGINPVSTNLNTYGNWTEVWYFGDEPETSDHNFSKGTFSTQVSGIGSSSTIDVVSTPHGWESAGSRISAFDLDMYSSSAPRWFDIPGGLGGLSGQEINIHSTATTRFSATGSRLILNLTSIAEYNYEHWEQDMTVVINDLTTNATVFKMENLDDYLNQSFNYVLGVNPSHEFELILSGRINSWDSKSVDEMKTTIAMSSVPEGGTTGLLSLLGVLGVLAIRWLF